MKQSNRNCMKKIHPLLLTAAMFVSLTIDSFVFAEGAQAGLTSNSGKPADQISEKSEPAAAAGEVKLKTKEEVYQGMLEAEQRRIAAGQSDSAIDNRKIIERWGVEVISVSYAADGFWLDFRFRVFDPEKAGVLFDNRYKPYLQSEASGQKFAVPSAAKVGALRTTNRGHNVQAGKVYTIMFANPGFHVKPGQLVTVAAGDFKAEHLTVRGSSQNLSVKQ